MRKKKEKGKEKRNEKEKEKKSLLVRWCWSLESYKERFAGRRRAVRVCRIGHRGVGLDILIIKGNSGLIEVS